MVPPPSRNGAPPSRNGAPLPPVGMVPLTGVWPLKQVGGLSYKQERAHSTHLHHRLPPSLPKFT